MLGYSVYFSQLDDDFIKKMDKKGFKTIFTSLHIPEEEITHEEIRQFFHDSKEKDRDVVVDISNNTMEVIGVEKYEDMKDLGVKTVRIDFGITDEEIVHLQQHFRIVLNASTLDEHEILKLQSKGLDLTKVIAMHNFYPREHTGLSLDFFRERTETFEKYGIKTWTFVPGNKGLRGPIHAGLPTVEKHRKESPYVGYVEFVQEYNVDGVFIGDAFVDDETLEMMERFAKEQVITLPTKDLSPFIPKDVIYTNRMDEAKEVIRIEQGRKMFATEIKLYETTKPGKRHIGTITVDNEKYLRYQGETQILRKNLSEDPRVNIIGHVKEAYIGLLDHIKAGTKIKFD